MIIIGYQGIGKSTLSKRNLKYIDLESGCFWVNGNRDKNWYIEYTQIAEHLSKQGYIVFVSSHEVVRNALRNSSEKVCCCFPSVELKDAWVEKLKQRYNKSGLEKDKKAYLNAKDRYAENINEIKISGFDNIIIKNMQYSLQKEIDTYIYCTLTLTSLKVKLLKRQQELLLKWQESYGKKISTHILEIDAKIDELNEILNLIEDFEHE